MAILQIKKYKIIKDELGNKVQVQKTKEEWNKETKNGTATWYFYSRYKINNQIKQYKSGVFALKRNAEEEERLFKASPLEYIKTHSKKAKIRFNDISNDIKLKTLNDYFPMFCENKLKYNKESVVYEYKVDWKNHIKDFIGDLTPNQLNYTVIQNWRDNIDLAKRNNGVPYSIGAKNKWHSCLVAFLGFLKSNGIIEINFAKEIGQFKNLKENKNIKKKIKYQTLEDFEFFINELNKDDFWYAFFNFAFWHGLRIGEQRALKIKDIDFKEEIIHIHQTFAKSKDGGQKIGTIKNNKERYIALSPNSKQYLNKLIDFYKQLDGYNEDWFLFGGAISTYKNRIERKINELYKNLIAKYPNKVITPLTHHEFGRHSHASYLLNKGLEEGLPRDVIYEIIAERLGDTVDVIKSTYAHPYENKYSEKARNLIK